MNKVYVPKDEITTIPSGWNEDCDKYIRMPPVKEYTVQAKITSVEKGKLRVIDEFDFLNDPSEDIYSLEDGKEIK